MDSNELDLSNINIKTHELDLDCYLDGLIEIKKDIDRYKDVQSLMYRYLIANFSLFTRNLTRGFDTNISKKWEKYFEYKQKELEKELEEIQIITDRFDFENSSTWKEITDKKVLDYFFPNEIDFIYINKLRKSGFEVDLKDYKTKTKLKSIPEKLIIQSILDNISYNYVEYYKDGEPLQMARLGKSRGSISMDIGMDLGKYDMVKYLKNRLNEIENGSNGSQKQIKIELSNLSVIQTMLHYVYRQECHEYPKFTNNLIDEMKKISLETGKSENTLKIKYYQVNHIDRRKSLRKIDIESVINSLDAYPKAQNLAKDELKLIELNS